MMPSPAFFVDECVARLIVDGLRLRGFDAIDAMDVCRGDNDERVLAMAAAAGRVVNTHDWGGSRIDFPSTPACQRHHHPRAICNVG